jgi:hypothetical protein
MKKYKIKDILVLSVISFITSIIIILIIYLLIDKFSLIKDLFNQYFYDVMGIGFILFFLSLYIFINFISIIISSYILKIKGNYKILSISFIIILISHIFLTFSANSFTFIFWVLLFFCPIYFSILFKIKNMAINSQ